MMSSILPRLSHQSTPLTVRQVAEILGVSRPTMYRIIAAGDIVAIRVGGSTRIMPTEVDRYLANAQRAAAGLPPIDYADSIESAQS